MSLLKEEEVVVSRKEVLGNDQYAYRVPLTVKVPSGRQESEEVLEAVKGLDLIEEGFQMVLLRVGPGDHSLMK